MAARAAAGEANWLASFSEAVDQARAERELLLLDFTGSDWCGWCMKLDEETFTKPEFIDYAAKNLALYRADFPRQKSLPDDVKSANRELAKRYAVNGFPTVLVIKPDGEILWEQRGYAPGGPTAIIEAVNRCRRATGLATPVKPVAVAAPKAPTPLPAPAPAAPPPQMTIEAPKLQGILYSPTHSSVVLDGKICEEGDTVHDVRVVKISRDQVTVDYHGQVKVLKLIENDAGR